MRVIHVVGTADTKGEELAYLRDLIVAGGQQALIVDLGTRTPSVRSMFRQRTSHPATRTAQARCWAETIANRGIGNVCRFFAMVPPAQ